VLLARTVPGFATDVVELDDKGAAYEGVTHLLRLGYRRVGFIGGLRGASTSRKRLDGYKAALRDWKLKVDRALVVEGDFRVESGYQAGLALLKARPDAVFIANYLMTVGFMEALRQYRLRCPRMSRSSRATTTRGWTRSHRGSRPSTSEARARRRCRAAAGRTDREAERPPACGQAEERDAGAESCGCGLRGTTAMAR
jgi:hypothetical protein